MNCFLLKHLYSSLCHLKIIKLNASYFTKNGLSLNVFLERRITLMYSYSLIQKWKGKYLCLWLFVWSLVTIIKSCILRRKRLLFRRRSTFRLYVNKKFVVTYNSISTVCVWSYSSFASNFTNVRVFRITWTNLRQRLLNLKSISIKFEVYIIILRI